MSEERGRLIGWVLYICPDCGDGGIGTLRHRKGCEGECERIEVFPASTLQAAEARAQELEDQLQETGNELLSAVIHRHDDLKAAEHRVSELEEALESVLNVGDKAACDVVRAALKETP